MPINIYIEETGQQIGLLCNDVWSLPNQIDALEIWLNETGKNLEPNKYVVDIGFDIRKDASGDGAVLNSESMKVLGAIGMDIYLSEYLKQG